MNVPKHLGNKDTRQAIAATCMEAAVYVKGLDKLSFGAFIRHLKNDYTKGIDNYPTDLATAFAMVNLYELPQNQSCQSAKSHGQQNQQQQQPQTDQVRIKPTATISPGSNYTFVQNETS